MADERIIYNGVEVVAWWPERIEAAQFVTEYDFDDGEYARVRYGDEERPWPPGACHDCAVLRGQYHVPGCDAEECPRCRGQAIGCDCPHGDDEPLAGKES
jgi:hypothetical protein